MSNIQDIVNKEASELTIEEIQELQDFVNRILGNVPEYYSYENILKRMIENAPETIDKRVGSIFYDAIAPCAGEIANEYIEIQIFKDQVYLLTAIGDNLDKIGENYLIPRKKATKALRIAQFIDTNDNLIDLPIGRRFSVPDSDSTITYVITKQIDTGKAIIECEQYGTIGNEYYGAILPLFSINNLQEATIIGTQQPAQDIEDDDDYRQRIIDKLNSKPFGGNIADYKEYVSNISGTSEPKVFPVWDGGGTVKLSILDSQYNAISNEFIAQIKEEIDPTIYTGQGVGTAPIGHIVTVVTPTELTVNIVADVQLREDKTIETVQEAIEEAIETYFLNIRKNWVDSDYTNVYITQVIAAMMSVPGVINVDRNTITLNDETSDIELENTAENQYIPILGTVELNEIE
jgi:uncharacterized phage protein gp47/JayE